MRLLITQFFNSCNGKSSRLRLIMIIIKMIIVFLDGNTFSEKKLVFYEALYKLTPKIMVVVFAYVRN